MTDLKCPHCGAELREVWFNIQSGWENWAVEEGSLLFLETTVDEAVGPLCSDCDEEVQAYLTKMGVNY